MKRRFVIVAVIVAILGVCTVWWISSSADRRVAAATQEVSDLLEEQAAESPESNSFHVKDVEAIDNLKEEDLEVFSKQMVPEVMKAVSSKYERILNMPPDEQREALDKIIDEQVARAGDLPRGPRSPGMTRQVMMRRQGPDGEISEPTKVVDTQTDEGERYFVDNTSAEQRSVMNQYIELLRARMKERGIDPSKVPISISMQIESERSGHQTEL